MDKKAALTTTERNRLARKRKLEREVEQYFQNIPATSTMSLEEKIERYKSDEKRRKQMEKKTHHSVGQFYQHTRYANTIRKRVTGYGLFFRNLTLHVACNALNVIRRFFLTGNWGTWHELRVRHINAL